MMSNLRKYAITFKRGTHNLSYYVSRTQRYLQSSGALQISEAMKGGVGAWRLRTEYEDEYDEKNDFLNNSRKLFQRGTQSVNILHSEDVRD